MLQEQKLSLSTAILINLNIMLGAGIFINTVELSKRAGALSSLSYLLVAILIFPLISSFAKLASIHPEGGFYRYGEQEINPFVGFLATWSYFIGKLASSTIMIHVAVSLIQQLIPLLAHFNTIALDVFVLSIFVALNMLNIKAGSKIQSLFMGFKIVPIIFAIVAGLFLFNGQHFTTPHIIWSGIPSSLPLIFYAMVGFEAACSLSSKIKNAKKNAPRAIFISYGIVVTIAVLYQLMCYGALGSYFALATDYRNIFPAFLDKLLPHTPQLGNKLVGLLHLAISSSALGGAYGIIFSNNWNLYILAQQKLTFFPNLLTKLNRNQIPMICVLVQGLVCFIYFIVTQGEQVALQQISALGLALSYSLGVLALAIAALKKPHYKINKLLPLLGLASCSLLIFSCLHNFMISGFNTLIAFCVMLGIGITMFLSKKNKPLPH